MKRFLAAIVVLALMLPAGCGLQGTAAGAYPEAWAFLRAAYGSLAGVDTDGNFVLRLPEGDAPFQPETPPEQGGVYGEDVVLEVVSVETTAEIGYAVSYNLDNPGEPCFLSFVPRVPDLYVWLDGTWWPVPTEKRPDAELGIWMSYHGNGPFMKPMTAAGMGKPLPSGRYCLAMDLTEELGVTLRTEFDHTLSPDAGDPVGETMRDMYPETWRFFRSIYGDKFTLDEEGNFAYLIGENQKVPQTPARDTYPPFTAENVTIELGGSEHTADVLEHTGRPENGPITTFIIRNHSGADLSVANNFPYLQVFLDGCWWGLQTIFDTGNLAAVWDVRAGETTTVKFMRAHTTWLPFPDGHYRYVQQFYLTSQNHGIDTYLTLEFDYVYEGA